MREPIHFILSTSDFGAGTKGAADGPLAVQDKLVAAGIASDSFEVLQPLFGNSKVAENIGAKYIDNLLDTMTQLSEKVTSVIEQHRFPILLSGDHSNAIGGLSGLKEMNADKTIGVIWIDAHADIHSPYTTPSGNLHGMPLAALAGLDNLELKNKEISEDVAYYWNELKHLGFHHISPKFNLDNLVLIGVRDAEDEEWDILERSGVKVFEPEHIKSLGMPNVIEQAVKQLENCDLIYVSFDADSLDPTISTGTGTKAENGLTIEDAKCVFEQLFANKKVKAFEITEVNPNLDSPESSKMADVIAELLLHGLKQNNLM